ncbi:hypothetical protein CB1_000274017 [Camelus ferus]|nr:hypothetical protein CB1_000274017 [Camelus ferus]
MGMKSDASSQALLCPRLGWKYGRTELIVSSEWEDWCSEERPAPNWGCPENRCSDTWLAGPLSLPQPPSGKVPHSHEGKEPGDLRFSKGDVIVLRHRVDEHWYHGFLPTSYVPGLRPLPQAPPQGKALYDFEMKDRDQDKDCLTFSKAGGHAGVNRAGLQLHLRLQSPRQLIVLLPVCSEQNLAEPTCDSSQRYRHPSRSGTQAHHRSPCSSSSRVLPPHPALQGPRLLTNLLVLFLYLCVCVYSAPFQDEVLTVIRRVDDNWAEGMLGDKIGIFPLLYVEGGIRTLNDAAKQLMEMDKPGLAMASGCLTSLPSDPSTAIRAIPGPTSGSTGAVSAFQRRVDSKKNAKKRHSFTALSMTHKSAQAASHRRSMEISAPVLISSSDPRAAARIGDLSHLSCSAPAQPRPGVQQPSALPTVLLRGSFVTPEPVSPMAEPGTLAGQRDSSSAGPAPAAEQQGMAPKVQLPLNV